MAHVIHESGSKVYKETSLLVCATGTTVPNIEKQAAKRVEVFAQFAKATPVQKVDKANQSLT